MKPETKDWIKRTAGTSALIASPGIVAATLAGGLPVGLLVGGAVAAGNVVGSAAYKKAKEVKEDIENRRRFRELQNHVLAENGILYYQPMVPAPVKGPGDMACKDMSCLGKILNKDFGLEVITRPIGEKIANTPFGRGVSFVSDLGNGVINRPGKPTIADNVNAIFHTGNYSCGNFSEENLLSVEEEDLKRMKDEVEFTDDPSEKELKKSRYLSMLNSDSRDKFEELLGEKKEDPKTCDCESLTPPIAMFSESPNLQYIAEGRDFGVRRDFLKGIISKAKSVASKVASSIKTPSADVAGNISKTVTDSAGEAGKNIVEDAVKTGEKALDQASKAKSEISNPDYSPLSKPKRLMNSFTSRGRQANLKDDILTGKNALGKKFVDAGVDVNLVSQVGSTATDLLKRKMQIDAAKAEAQRNQNTNRA